MQALYNNIGIIYFNKKNYDKAFVFYENAIKISKKESDDFMTSMCLRNIARIYEKKGEYIIALKYYNEALKIVEEKGFLSKLSMYYNDISNVYSSLNDNDQAENFALKSLEIAKNLNVDIDLYDAYYSLTKIAEKNGDYKKAYEYHKKFDASRDSIFNSEKSRQIAEIQVIYQIDKKNEEIYFLKEKGKYQKTIRNTFIALFIVILLLLLFIVSRFRLRNRLLKKDKQQMELKVEKEIIQRKQIETENKLKEEENLRFQTELTAQKEISKIRNEKLKIDLDHRNRELTSSTMYIYQKNQILSEIKAKVNDLIIKSDSSHKQQLAEIDKMIKMSLEINEDWRNLKMHFERVHPNFFKKLQEKFPALTKNELKFCAYMKINLSSKEIARLLNVSTKSTQMTRYRLKKKMKLSEEINLSDFIMEF